MASATGRDGQASGLGLRLELIQGPGGPQMRLLAGPAELLPGLRLLALIAEPLAAGADEDEPEPPRPGTPDSLAALRSGRWRATEVRLEVAADALERAGQCLVGAQIGGWPIEQVMVEVTGERGVLTLVGPRDQGWPGLVQVELAARALGAAVQVEARRVWATGPLAPRGQALCEALARQLVARHPGVVALSAGGLRIDPTWALRRAFAAAGARPPQTAGLQLARLRGEGRGLRLVLVRSGMSIRAGPQGHARADMSQGPEDPLAGLRAALRAGDRGQALAELDRAPAPGHPGARRLTGALARVRAELLRFCDREGAAAAVRAWLAATPDDPDAWWRVVVQHARAGESEGLARGLAALERMTGATLRRPPARARGEATEAVRANDASFVAPVAVPAALPDDDAEERAPVAPAGVDVAAEVASLAAVALRLARGGPLARLEAIVEATAERVGSAARLRTTLRARARAQPIHPGVVLALWSMLERTGNSARALAQLAAFMLPRAAIPVEPGRIEFRRALADAAASAPRAAIVEVLRGMVAETGGIRAPGPGQAPPDPPAAEQALALAEAELPPLRAAVGLGLPLRIGRGVGPVGGVGIRNDREPAIVVYPALAQLPASERQFRLALAAALIRAGLALVLDPKGASLHELLAALAHLADPSQPPGLPGAQTIVRVWRGRGFSGDRLAPALRAELARELAVCRQDAGQVARLAGLLRGDHVDAAVRLAGRLDGALLAIGRDARLLASHDEAGARAVLATEDAQRLLRGLALFNRECRQ